MRKLIVLLCLVVLGCEAPKPQHQYKYAVRLSNWVGGETYCCDSFVNTGNTYKLYDSLGGFKHELAITPGYVITIDKLEAK